MPADDNVIDDSVVRVSPDLTGFRRKLQRELKAESAGLEAKIRMAVVSTGFTSQVRKALREITVPDLRVRLVADTRGFEANLRRTLRDRVVNVRVNTLSSAGGATGEAAFQRAARDAERASNVIYRRVRTNQEKVQQAEDQAHATRLARTRGFQEAMDHLHIAALNEEVRRVQRAEVEQTRQVERGQRERLAARRRLANSPLVRASEGRGLIDFGGAGIRPSNLLLSAVVALSPALISVASSATLASTSVAALGAASIGAAGATTALVVGFTRIREALALRQQVRKEEQRTQAVARQTARSEAAQEAAAERLAASRRALRDATWGVGDAQRNLADAERDSADARRKITDAYREAADKVRDLREEISDLRLEEAQGTLDVAAARERQAAVNRNFWATDLEKRQAALDVQKAIDRADDARRQRQEKTTELVKRQVAGPGQSPEVLEARRRAADAQRREADARRDAQQAMQRREDAVSALAKARRRDPEDGSSAATAAASAAAQDLQAQINAMSPAARKLYYWFRANEDALDGLRAKMEGAVLPGFLTFLQQVTDRRKARRSTLDILAGQAAILGRIVSDTVGRIGALTQTKWFRGDLATIGRENERSFTLLGQAAETALRPISAITAASAPLFTRFSQWILDITTRFDKFIQRTVKDGSLVQWFKDAGDELAKWGGIARNLLVFLREVFQASLPSGKDLVSRLGDLTKKLADWSTSDRGQKSIKDFFDFFKKIDYQRLATFAVQLGTVLAGLKVFTFGRKHPFYALMALLAAEYPQDAAKLLESTASAINSVLGFIVKYPAQSATLLAILTAARYGKSVTIGAKLLGLDGLSGVLEKLFGSKAGIMNVTAGVVNVNGGVPGVGPGGLPMPVPTGPMSLPTGPAALPLYGVGAVPNTDPNPEKFRLPTEAEKREARMRREQMTLWEKIRKGLGLGDGNPLPRGVYLAPGERNIRQADRNTPAFVAPTAAPGGKPLLRAEDQEALGTTLARWFGTTLPNAMTGRTGGWSGLAAAATEKFKTSVGYGVVTGLWEGVAEKATWLWDRLTGWKDSVVNKVKELFGINSPSTVFAGFGGNWIDGLWLGFTTTWDALLTTVQTWIGERITAPLMGTFSAAGTMITNAFSSTFDTLTSKLAGPVKTALDWIDRNVIDNLNKALSFVGVATIPNINMGGTTLTPTRPFPLSGDDVRKPNRLAGGGRVSGFSPNPRADNIPAMLTADEYVHPVDTVKHYGVGFMDRLRRKEIPRYAGGGLVADLENAVGGRNIATRLAGGAFAKMGGSTLGALTKAVVAKLGSLFGGSSGGTAVGDIDVARIAEATARSMGATNKQLVALIAAGVVESGMRNLNYGDRDSLGFLQQRPSQGWGSPAQVMDVAYATRSFINRAKAADRAGQTPGQLAQAVQRSAYPDRYDKRVADAYAILNREAPFVSGNTGSFPGWPANPGAQRGNTGIWQKVVALARSSGIPFNVTSSYRNGDPLWHGSGRAVDFGGYNQDALAQFFLSMKGRILELIHRTGTRDYGVRRGHDAAFPTQWPLHRDHLHVAMAGGGLVPKLPIRAYDSGGDLPPGLTLAVNGTGRTETVRTHEQERSLSGGGDGRWMRLDRRDLALLAQYISAAQQPTVHMDGRAVAEITNGYHLLPGGF